MIRLAAVDVGNDTVKALLGPDKTQMTIPNIIAPTSKHRIIKEMENTIVEGLHVSISSDCLKQGYGNYLVGELARSSHTLSELNNNSLKGENDQTLVLLLTTLAIDAVTSGVFQERDGVIEAHYILSTGLPINEGTYENRMKYKQKLEKSVHELEFLQTPTVIGKRVKIFLDKVLPNIEGISAFITLSQNQKELSTKPVMVFDIGGLTTDIAIIVNNKLNNDFSRSFNEGIAFYLDRIMSRIEMDFHYSMKSRRDLITIMTNDNEDERNHIYHFGRKISIQSIVDHELLNFAKKQVQRMFAIWNLVPELQVCYVIGGSSVILQEYIKKVMLLEQQELPLNFVDKETSIWTNVHSYDTILEASIKLDNHQRIVSL